MSPDMCYLCLRYIQGRGKATQGAGLSPIQKKKQFLLALAHLPRIETILPFADEFDDLLLRSGFPRFRDTGDDLRSGAKANRNIPFFYWAQARARGCFSPT